MICRNPMIPCKAMTKHLYRNSEKRFLECTKKGLRNIFRHFFHSIFFMFVLLISNHTVLLVQFGTNLHLWVFQKAEIALAEAASAISAFWKTHSCKLIPNWTRNRMITYTNMDRGHFCRFCQHEGRKGNEMVCLLLYRSPQSFGAAWRILSKSPCLHRTSLIIKLENTFYPRQVLVESMLVRLKREICFLIRCADFVYMGVP